MNLSHVVKYVVFFLIVVAYWTSCHLCWLIMFPLVLSQVAITETFIIALATTKWVTQFMLHSQMSLFTGDEFTAAINQTLKTKYCCVQQKQ